jgi:hypothetical protein
MAPRRRSASSEDIYESTGTDLAQALKELAIATRRPGEAPPFDGAKSNVDQWLRQARRYLEKSGEKGRDAVLALAAKFTGPADVWFERLKPSPTSPEKLLQAALLRFKGEVVEEHPAKTFYKAVVAGKKANQSWEEHILELNDLAMAADETEESALEDIRANSKLEDPKLMAAINSWKALLRLAHLKDTTMNPVSDTRRWEPKPETELAKGKKVFFTSGNKSSSSSYSAVRAKMYVNGTELQVIIDSGSGVTIISEALTKELNLETHGHFRETIITASGQRVMTKSNRFTGCYGFYGVCGKCSDIACGKLSPPSGKRHTGVPEDAVGFWYSPNMV